MNREPGGNGMARDEGRLCHVTGGCGVSAFFFFSYDNSMNHFFLCADALRTSHSAAVMECS